uniref:PITH domain-containing protein n=2 Tax=Anisakis simplex TaxID=6269 RepID=A0A0M3JNG5_ANISI
LLETNFTIDDIPMAVVNVVDEDGITDLHQFQRTCADDTDMTFVRRRQAFFEGTPSAIAMVCCSNLNNLTFYRVSPSTNKFISQ